MRPLIYFMAAMCLITAIASSVFLVRSFDHVDVPSTSPPPSGQQAPLLGDNPGTAVTAQPAHGVIAKSSAVAASPAVPTDTASPTGEHLGAATRAQGDEGPQPTPSEAFPVADDARERVAPILQAIVLHADNKPLRASLISDIRRAGPEAIRAAMPELLTVLDADADPGVQLVLVSTMSRAPDAVPVSALPLIKRIVRSETAQRELRDQGNYLIGRLEDRD